MTEDVAKRACAAENRDLGNFSECSIHDACELQRIFHYVLKWRGGRCDGIWSIVTGGRSGQSTVSPMSRGGALQVNHIVRPVPCVHQNGHEVGIVHICRNVVSLGTVHILPLFRVSQAIRVLGTAQGVPWSRL